MAEPRKKALISHGIAAQNSKARFDYKILDTYEAGIVLVGPEVKSLRAGRATLTEAEVDPDPTVQFAAWFQQAMEAGIPEANAMSVATVGADGRPSSRILLIKDFSRDGFTWFTNYRSRKGQDLEAHPYAALLFHWVELERQVRIEGRVEKLAEA